jgi:hypothetical protein
MDPRRLLDRMCKRHGLQASSAKRLLPLIKRALGSPAKARDRILRLVENNLALRAKQSAFEAPDALYQDLDDEILLSVGNILHAWNPQGPILNLSNLAPDIFPAGTELDDER